MTNASNQPPPGEPEPLAFCHVCQLTHGPSEPFLLSHCNTHVQSTQVNIIHTSDHFLLTSMQGEAITSLSTWLQLHVYMCRQPRVCSLESRTGQHPLQFNLLECSKRHGKVHEFKTSKLCRARTAGLCGCASTSLALMENLRRVTDKLPTLPAVCQSAGSSIAPCLTMSPDVGALYMCGLSGQQRIQFVQRQLSPDPLRPLPVATELERVRTLFQQPTSWAVQLGVLALSQTRGLGNVASARAVRACMCTCGRRGPTGGQRAANCTEGNSAGPHLEVLSAKQRQMQRYHINHCLQVKQ